jgi:DNA-binding CsgD family transcriptional regulator
MGKDFSSNDFRFDSDDSVNGYPDTHGSSNSEPDFAIDMATAPTSQRSNPFFQALVESLDCFDGAMILTKNGDLVVFNHHASQICHQLTCQFSKTLSHVPQQIWQCCQAILGNPLQSIEDEIKIDQSNAIRIRVSWLPAKYVDQPHLLVTLEDQRKSAKQRADTEARKYDLTAREAQIWILKRIGCSDKSIAMRLYIATNTVKKHVKSIRGKLGLSGC